MANTSEFPKKVLVFGATGVIGQYIIQGIYEARSSFDKIGIFTSPNTAETKPEAINGWKEKGVEVIVGDINSKHDIAKAYEGYDTIISALGRNAILSQIPLLSVAEASPNIHHFYPSEYGTDIEYGASSPTEKPHQLKLQVRKYIRENTKKLRVTYLVTGPYPEPFFVPGRKDPRVGNWDVAARQATILGTGDEKVSFTTMPDVGRLLVAALTTPFTPSTPTTFSPSTATERILKVNSFTTTSNQVLAEFEKQTGGGKWEVRYTSLEELKRVEEETWGKGDPFATAITLRRIWTEGGAQYREEERGNKEVGFEGKEEGLEGVVKQAVGDGA